jgi:hypothetical protein
MLWRSGIQSLFAWPVFERMMLVQVNRIRTYGALIELPLAVYHSLMGGCLLDSQEYEILKHSLISKVPEHLRGGNVVEFFCNATAHCIAIVRPSPAVNLLKKVLCFLPICPLCCMDCHHRLWRLS